MDCSTSLRLNPSLQRQIDKKAATNAAKRPPYHYWNLRNKEYHCLSLSFIAMWLSKVCRQLAERALLVTPKKKKSTSLRFQAQQELTLVCWFSRATQNSELMVRTGTAIFPQSNLRWLARSTHNHYHLIHASSLKPSILAYCKGFLQSSSLHAGCSGQGW